MLTITYLLVTILIVDCQPIKESIMFPKSSTEKKYHAVVYNCENAEFVANIST